MVLAIFRIKGDPRKRDENLENVYRLVVKWLINRLWQCETSIPLIGRNKIKVILVIMSWVGLKPNLYSFTAFTSFILI